MDFLLSINWFAVGQIILIDLLLGGDNAIVIALACRNLLPKLRRRGILLGTFGAIAIRIALIAFAVTLLQVPYLKVAGGCLLFWIGIKLLVDDDGHAAIQGSERLIDAVTPWLEAYAVSSAIVVPGIGLHFSMAGLLSAVAVVAIGKVLMQKRKRIHK